jgi:low temperature requirement protein LtrA
MAIGLILLLGIAISGLRRVVNGIWLIIIAVVLGVVGLVWFGSTLLDQPKPAAVAGIPTPASSPLEYGFDDDN